VGHHFVEALLKETKWEIIVLDSLNYSGNQNRLTDIECFDTKRIKYVYHNLQAPISETIHKMLGRLDYIVHLASETHVDNSLKDSIPFVMSNVLGTANLFEYLKKKQKRLKRLFHLIPMKYLVLHLKGFIIKNMIDLLLQIHTVQQRQDKRLLIMLFIIHLICQL